MQLVPLYEHGDPDRPGPYPHGNGGGSGAYPSFDAFAEHARTNLVRTSRTAKGVSDTSASADKPKLKTEGKALASQADRNFAAALKKVWTAKDKPMDTPEAVRAFVEDIADTISEGLLQPGQSPWRTWATKYKSTAPADIQRELDSFAVEYAKRLKGRADPIETAAWVEKTFENVHALADGVGRATKALSALALLKGGKPLPTYRSRDEYYGNIGLDHSHADWARYYRTLF